MRRDLMIKEYLEELDINFDVIAMTETWHKSEDDYMFDLNGCVVHHIERENKKGGVVAIYVRETIKHNVVKNMTKTVDNILECITIELNIEKRKNIVVSCMYRTPG